LKTVFQNSNLLLNVGIGAAIFVALAFRLIGIRYVSWDMRLYLFPWYDTLARDGFGAFARAFSNYTPSYLYFLWLATLAKKFLSKSLAIKIISNLFDLGNSLMVYKILMLKYSSKKIPVFGATVFLALPTMVLNSSFWGQADSTYTFFVLISLYYLLLNRSLPAMFAFGLAFAFKAQAILFTPLLFLLTLCRRIPWIYYLLIPTVYLIMMLPAALAGRPLTELMTIYLSQADTYKLLSKKAPNLYLFIPGSWYYPAVIIGVGITIVLVVIWALIYARRIKIMKPDHIILCAAISTICVPFLLPKMHERYFYLADVMIFLLAFYIPRLWFAPIASQIVSTLTYTIFLTMSPDSVPPFAALLILIAIPLNTVLVGYLIWYQYEYMVEEYT